MNITHLKAVAPLTSACLLVALALALFGPSNVCTAQADAGAVGLQSTKLNVQASEQSVELYRLYNLHTSEHLYTTDAAERDRLQASIWRYEGTTCTVPSNSNTPVFRLYNPSLGKHHYTTSIEERDWLTDNWWTYEGIGWFSDDNKRVPVYRLYSHVLSQHHYTTGSEERNWLMQNYWNNEDVGWYAISEGVPVANPYGDPNEIVKKLRLSIDIRPQLSHGEKTAQYQKYIVLHDTEGDGNANTTLQWWVANGKGIAAHFVVNKDGSILQCVPLDQIAHHAGLGTAGHNQLYGVDNSSRDDVKTWGNRYSNDRGMNSYSIGIELVHSGNKAYPEAQLQALDNLIAYIDAYYGFESTIIDHKMWRLGNSDTSAAFSQFLVNYRHHRTHN